MINKFKIDGLAISLSFLCAVHCLFVPSFIILAPSLLSISFYKAHKNLSMIFIGFLGLSILLFAVLFGNNLFGEIGEKGLTLFGSVIVASAHYRNLKVCKELDCDCHDSSV